MLTHLTEEKMEKYIASLFPEELSSVVIPKFVLKDSRTFDGIRPEIESFFTQTGGMSNLSPDLIGRPTARQQTSIMIDEEGSSVSSAIKDETGNIYHTTSNFILDRPFMFLIRDKTAKTNIFAGLVRKMNA